MHRDCTSVHVAPDDSSVAAATFLHPFDDIRPIDRPGSPRRVSRRQAVAALRAALLDVTPFPALIATAAARIDLLPYQLEPALALLTGAATRVLIADDVGLGKTVQAGIAMKELAARNEGSHVLLVVPAGLVDQWAQELDSRFGLAALQVNAPWLRAMSRSLPPWVNPWSVPGILLVSIDLLKRREVLAQIEHAVWDLVVIDEAHRGTGSTDRHRAASLACSRARRVMLLTATPHGGEQSGFRQIQELGALQHDGAPGLTFARTRSAVAPGTLQRRARYLRVPLTREERLMHAALDRYAARMWRADRGPRGEAVRLAMIVLKKRALSGAFPLKRSLVRRLAALNDLTDAPSQLGLCFDTDPHGELVADDQEPDAVLATLPHSGRRGERQQLEHLIARASAAVSRESKLAVLRRVLTHTGEPVVVFTEYRDTLEHVADAIAPITCPVLLHGGLPPHDRRRAVSAFTRGDARVLLATDAAAEGLNLHDRCRWVINVELPWAPLRLIQRAGRVDRIGQTRRVHAWHLVADGTDETRLLLTLSRRAERAESALARERALSERVMAEALVHRADPAIDSTAPVTTAAATIDEALAETARLERLRAFGGGHRSDLQTRPVVATVKRRRGFSRYGSHDRLMVVAGRASDADGCLVARRLGLVHLPVVGVSGPGVNELERQLQGDLERHRRATAVATARRGAIVSLIQRSRTLVQPALFDRRALDARDATHGAIDHALRHLRADEGSRGKSCEPSCEPPCEPSSEPSCAPSSEPSSEPSRANPSVEFDLVATFNVR